MSNISYHVETRCVLSNKNKIFLDQIANSLQGVNKTELPRSALRSYLSYQDQSKLIEHALLNKRDLRQLGFKK
jgi:hypothetical protein